MYVAPNHLQVGIALVREPEKAAAASSGSPALVVPGLEALAIGASANARRTGDVGGRSSRTFIRRWIRLRFDSAIEV